jgi:hypothetical protein
LPQISGVIIPQTVKCWLKYNSSYTGLLPGTPIAVSYVKTNGRYDGLVKNDREATPFNFLFKEAGEAQVIAAISLALGVTDYKLNANTHIKQKLSKSIDGLFLLHNTAVCTNRKVKFFNHQLRKSCGTCHQSWFRGSPTSYTGCACGSLNKNVPQSSLVTTVTPYEAYTVVEFGKGWTPDVIDALINKLRK